MSMTSTPSRRDVLLVAAAAAVLPARVLGAAPSTVALDTADGRRVSVTCWRAGRRRGTILFSHGALSAPWKYDALIEPWVADGWDVWAPLHVDSTDHPDTKLFPGLTSWPARIEDMRALAKHVGGDRHVAAGHSYGALVALTLGGASPTPPAGVTGPLADPLASCVVAFSPPGPGMGLIDVAGYATVARPALIETGTRDVPPGMADPASWRSHLVAFDAAAPAGDRYALTLDGADHYFGGAICRPELPGPKQTAQLAEAVRISRLFLGAYGLDDRDTARKLAASVTDDGPVRLARK